VGRQLPVSVALKLESSSAPDPPDLKANSSFISSQMAITGGSTESQHHKNNY
jgi:hypothetical protein